MSFVTCTACQHQFTASEEPDAPRLEADCPECGKRTKLTLNILKAAVSKFDDK